MSKTKLLRQNFLLIFQKSLTSNIFLDPKEGVNPPPLSPPMRMYEAIRLINQHLCVKKIQFGKFSAKKNIYKFSLQ